MYITFTRLPLPKFFSSFLGEEHSLERGRDLPTAQHLEKGRGLEILSFPMGQGSPVSRICSFVMLSNLGQVPSLHSEGSPPCEPTSAHSQGVLHHHLLSEYPLLFAAIITSPGVTSLRIAGAMRGLCISPSTAEIVGSDASKALQKASNFSSPW